VITGAGPVFCAGADLRDAKGRDPARMLRYHFNPLVLRIAELDKPLVTAINGPAYGAGVALALSGDIRLAGAAATFTPRFVQLGYTPDAAGEPLLTGTALDATASFHGIAAVLAAVYHKRATGEGVSLEVAMCDVTAQLTAPQMIISSLTGAVPTRSGNRAPERAPQGVYTCQDKPIALSVENDRQWESIAHLFSDLADADELGTLAGRQAHHDALDAITTWSARQTSAAAIETLRRFDVPACLVVDCVDVGDHPAIRARDRFVRINHPVVGTIEYPLWAIAGADPEPLFARPAPTLGQHNEEVLAELGFAADEIAALTATGVVSAQPGGAGTSRARE
jgi:crotonobetainyl-CoA:carnitine CoA-transferase CaiB-like acyl-CoA transferase